MAKSVVRWLATAVAFSAALGGCGGGGGSDGGSSANPADTALTPPTPSALGSVLASNAAELRPLVATAQWRYHGTAYTAAGEPGTYYESSTLQTAASDGSTQEQQRNVFQDDSSNKVAISDGKVMVTSTSLLGTGEAITYTELRSPVQVNDQYVQVQKTGVSVDDIDGDGKSDRADITLYATVIGQESVTLPDLNRTLAAVRVNTTALLRFTRSSDGVTTPVYNSVLSTWYVTGVGIVKQQTTALSTSGPGPTDADEILYSWDGVTQGLGSVPRYAVAKPSNGGATTYLSAPLAGTVLGDQALLVSGSDGSDVGEVTVLDKRGQLVTTKQIAQLISTDATPTNTKLYALGANQALLTTVARDDFGNHFLNLQTLDTSTTKVGAVRQLALNTNNNNLNAIWDGQHLWVTASHWSDASSAYQLTLQAYDLDGNPSGSAYTLDSSLVGSFGFIRSSAAEGQVLITWISDYPIQAYRYALIRSAGSAPQVATLGTSAQPGPSPDLSAAPVPVIGSGVAAILWRGPIFSYTSSGPLPEYLPRGVMLDSAGQPIRSTTGSLDNEKLPVRWGIQDGGAMAASAIGGRLLLGGYATDQPARLPSASTDQMYLSTLSSGTAALASQASAAPVISTDSGTLPYLDETGKPVLILPWSDRALVIGSVQGVFSAVTLVWFN